MTKEDSYLIAKKKLESTLHKLSGKRALSRVFSDLVEIVAISISNRVDQGQFQVRETRYLEIIKQYSRDEIDLFTQATAEMFLALNAAASTGRLRDMLGVLYTRLGLNNDKQGQVFTPLQIPELFSELAFMNVKDAESFPVKVCDLAAGSGVLLLGYANKLIGQNLFYPTHMVAEAVDLDLTCVHMCYIQFSIYGIAATVSHGNSLTMETFSTWHTPMRLILGR